MSEYVGNELGIFKHARNWKAYYGGMVAPFLGREVLEVGAGIGANTSLFCSGAQARWVCLEPDPGMSRSLDAQIAAGTLPSCCKAFTGTLADLPSDKFDSLIYIDVLEHIPDDEAEVRRALPFLRPGGHLVVLSPAHQFLYSPFDASIGHCRRYTKNSLRKIVPIAPTLLRYLDAAGMLLSLANRLLLKQSMPTLKQIQFWDTRIVPLSKKIDPLLGYRVGKSVLGAWRV
jgi:2-polyprenyl-3-methyl-5-hydroxy-6-metoxy-1,4-benzoquinol methylase